MKSVMSILSCILFISAAQCMQQASELSGNTQEPCSSAMRYTHHLLTRTAQPSKSLDTCKTPFECFATYQPSPDYLRSLATYLEKYGQESLRDNTTACGMIGPMMFAHRCSIIKDLCERAASSASTPSCTCATKLISFVQRTYPGLHNEKPSAIAHTLAHSRMSDVLNGCATELNRDATFLRNAQPPIEKQVKEHVLNEHTTITAILLAAWNLIPANKE